MPSLNKNASTIVLVVFAALGLWVFLSLLNGTVFSSFSDTNSCGVSLRSDYTSPEGNYSAQVVFENCSRTGIRSRVLLWYGNSDSGRTSYRELLSIEQKNH